MLMKIDTERPPTFERPHRLTDYPVLLQDGSTISAEKLAQRFYDSDLGKAMPNQPLRYEANFGYDRDSMLVDLGHDVCPIGHQMELAYHLGTIIEAEENEGTVLSSLTDEEIGLLMFACMVHDAGETTHPTIVEAGLTPVGDIPAGEKTAKNRENETAIREYIWNSLFDDVEPETIARVEAIIAHQDATILHDYFEAAHLVQMFETSNFAYHALAREQHYRHGEIIDPQNDEHARLSGLLGIARVPYLRSQNEIQKYSYFSHVRTVMDDAETLRTPPHRLLNSLY